MPLCVFDESADEAEIEKAKYILVADFDCEWRPNVEQPKSWDLFVGSLEEPVASLGWGTYNPEGEVWVVSIFLPGADPEEQVAGHYYTDAREGKSVVDDVVGEWFDRFFAPRPAA